MFRIHSLRFGLRGKKGLDWAHIIGWLPAPEISGETEADDAAKMGIIIEEWSKKRGPVEPQRNRGITWRLRDPLKEYVGKNFEEATFWIVLHGARWFSEGMYLVVCYGSLSKYFPCIPDKGEPHKPLANPVEP